METSKLAEIDRTKIEDIKELLRRVVNKRAS